MYFLLALVLCLGGTFLGVTPLGGTRVSPSPWLAVVPPIAVNLFFFWSAIRPGRWDRTVRNLLLLDLGMGAIFVGFLCLTSIPAFFVGEPRLGWPALGVFLAVVAGALLARHVFGGRPIPAWLMPVKGQWARRLAAGVAVLLLQPVSPAALSVLFSTVLGIGASGVQRLALQLCALTAPFYLAPLYRLLVEGKRRVVVWRPTLEEFLVEHRRAHSDAESAFARMVMRLELPLHRRVSGRGVSSSFATAKIRDYLLECWRTWPAARFDEITEADLPLMAGLAYDRTAATDPSGEKGDLWTVQALNRLSNRAREMTCVWLIDNAQFAYLAQTYSEPDHVLAAEVRSAAIEILRFIAAELPPRENEVSSKECAARVNERQASSLHSTDRGC